MEKIYYTEDGWICERYPYWYDATDKYVEVTDEEFQATLHCPTLKFWKVVGGKLELVDYDIDTPETRCIKISMLKERLASSDYQAIKYAEGQLSEEEYAPIKAQRQAWRDEINRLEELE